MNVKLLKKYCTRIPNTENAKSWIFVKVPKRLIKSRFAYNSIPKFDESCRPPIRIQLDYKKLSPRISE